MQDHTSLDTLLQRFREIVSEATDRISSLLEEERPARADIDRAHALVDTAAEAYETLLQAVSPSEREQIERVQGRALTDLRRFAGRLPPPVGGKAVPKARDATPSGGQPFILTREPPKVMQPSLREGFRHGASGFRVGGLVEAWCTPCGGMMGHTILALVSGVPKQVQCEACGAKHSYRTEPPKRRGGTEPSAKPTAASLQAKKAEEARFALIKELAAAENPRPFRTGERYKAGEIIEHPEHGRGKVETVVRGAIVVRFRDGVKSLLTS